MNTTLACTIIFQAAKHDQLGPPTRLAAFQNYRAIKNKNGDIYLLKDEGEESTTTTEEGESEETTESTTEGEKEADKKEPSAERVIAALKGKLRERRRRRNRDRYFYY